MDKVLKQDSSKCIAPSSEPFRIYPVNVIVVNRIHSIGGGSSGHLKTFGKQLLLQNRCFRGNSWQ
jgi:hypothetical protein